MLEPCMKIFFEIKYAQIPWQQTLWSSPWKIKFELKKQDWWASLIFPIKGMKQRSMHMVRESWFKTLRISMGVFKSIKAWLNSIVNIHATGNSKNAQNRSSEMHQHRFLYFVFRFNHQCYWCAIHVCRDWRCCPLWLCTRPSWPQL